MNCECCLLNHRHQIHQIPIHLNRSKTIHHSSMEFDKILLSQFENSQSNKHFWFRCRGDAPKATQFLCDAQMIMPHFKWIRCVVWPIERVNERQWQIRRSKKDKSDPICFTSVATNKIESLICVQHKDQNQYYSMQWHRMSQKHWLSATICTAQRRTSAFQWNWIQNVEWQRECVVQCQKERETDRERGRAIEKRSATHRLKA